MSQETATTRRDDGAMASGTRQVARLDIPGGGQVFVHRNHAYVGHMSPPDGTSIIDVRDPAHPRVVATIAPPDRFSHTHKVRVAGDLMITNVERHRRHFYRKGENLEGVAIDLTSRLGRDPSETELADALGVAPQDMADLREGLERGYADGGFRVWNIADPANPRLLSYVKTGGVGVHRFDMDERYAYISTEMEGYLGNILVIYDLADPTEPKEVSRWSLPGQHTAGGETPTWRGQRHRLHHALREGDKLWAACWHAGGYVVDISDITTPKTVGSYDYHPPFPEPTHTFFRLPEQVGGCDVALMIDEEHDHVPGQPHGFLWIMDASDPADLKPISTFHVSERDSPYARAGGRFGAHQFQEHQQGTLVYAAWFAGGLRVIDIADPAVPRGIVYLLDRDRGLELVERT